jgi:hypothetical protein
MNKTKIIFWFCVVTFVLFSFTFAEKTNGPASVVSDREVEQSGSQPNQPAKVSLAVSNESIKPMEKTAPASFKLVTDAIDGFGGQKSNSGCDRYIFAGGQSSAIGPSNSTNFKLYAGFVHSTVVKCGDANADGSLTVSDVVYLVNYLFKGGPIPKPYEAGEANCDGKITVSDVVYLVNYLFKGGPPPVC